MGGPPPMANVRRIMTASMAPLKAQALAVLGERRHEVPTRSTIFE
jgi:hypothetical protein